VGTPASLILGDHSDWLQGVLARSTQSPSGQPPQDIGGGTYKESEEQRLREDLQTRQLLDGPGDPATMRAVVDLAEVLVERGQLRAAEETIHQALIAHPRTFGLASPGVMQTWCILGKVLNEQGHYDLAQGLLQLLMNFGEAASSVDQGCFMNITANLAVAYFHLGRYGEAESLQRQAVARANELGRIVDASTYLIDLARTVASQDNGAEAVRLLEEATTRSRNEIGPCHPTTLACQSALACFHSCQGNGDDAKSLAARTWDSAESVLGSDHPQTLEALFSLTAILVDTGASKLAHSHACQLVNTSEAVLGLHHRRTVEYTGLLESMFTSLWKQEDAADQHKAVIKTQPTILGEGHPSAMRSWAGLAGIRRFWAKLGDTESVQARWLGWRVGCFGAEERESIWWLIRRWGTLWRRGGRLMHEAAERLRRAAEVGCRSLGENSPVTLMIRTGLSRVLGILGLHGEAEELARRTVEKTMAIRGGKAVDILDALDAWARGLFCLDRLEEAVEVMLRSVTFSETTLGMAHEETVKLRAQLDNLAEELETLAAEIEEGKV